MLNFSVQAQNQPNWGQLLRFSKGQIIYLEGDCPSGWYAVLEGVIRTCRFDVDGHRQITAFHYVDDVFGLDETSHAEAAEAVTDVSIWCLPVPANDVGEDNRHRSGIFRHALKRALESAQRRIHLFGRRTASERLAAFILMTEARSGAGDGFDFTMSRTDMADYLGLTMHTVSRTMTQLCGEKLISRDRPQHCRILNFGALRVLAGAVPS